MSFLGDFALGSTFDTKFCTVTTTGAPTTLAGTPVISAYLDNNTTQLTAGLTLSVDFDGVTGLNNIHVVATSGNGYATATNYQLVITTGTVGGTSVVGYVVGEFSIEARSGLRPTTAGRTLDVSAGGEAGLDWANIGSPTTAQNLSATNIDVDQVVASVSGAVGSVTGAVGSISAGGITAASIAADAITAAKIADGAIDAATFAAGAITATVIADGAIDAATFAANAITSTVIANDAITDAKVAADVTIASVTGAVGSVTGAVGSVTGAVGSIATGGIAAASFAAGAIDAAAIAANAIGASELAADAVAEIADGVWDEVSSGHVTVGTFGQFLFTPRSGTAQAGAAGSITLDASASAVDDFYKNSIVVITAGTGVGQSRTISTYTGATKVAAVTPNWVTTPSSDSVFFIIPNGAIAGATAPTAAEVADAVWDEDATGHQTGGTFGQAIGDPGADTTTIYQSVVTDAAGTNVAIDVIAVKAETASIQTDTNDIQTRLPAALVSGRIDASVGAMAANTITATAIAADAITAAKVADGTIDAATFAANAITSTVIANDAITDAKVAADVTIASVTGAVGSVTGAVGSVTGNVGGNVTGSVGSVATGGIAAASFAAGAIDAAAIAANAIGASELAADAVTEIADGILARDIGSGTNAVTLDERTVRSALRFLRNKWSITGAALTVTTENDTTTAWTSTLTATAGVDPITATDPA